MASSSTGRRSTSTFRSSILVCDCGESSVLRTSHTAKNPDRKFWGCKYYPCKGYCKFFFWDDEVCDLLDSDGPQLIRRIVSLRRQLDEEQNNNRSLKDEQQRTIDRLTIAKNRLYFALFVCWIVMIVWFFLVVLMVGGKN